LDETIKAVQQEVDKLKTQGINKIILLSHLGLERDKELASRTEGIDVIIGGHTHELLKDIKENKNLVYSKTGEPVIITEAGKDGKYFGELKLSFDKNGIISKAQNNIGDTSLYHKNLIHQYMFDEILGKPEVVGQIKYALPAAESLLDENPHANFMCDAMCYEMDAEIGIWNNSGTRNYFKEGIIDTSDIKEIAPFADNISVAEVSEKTLVDAFKKAVEVSYNSIGNKPGLLAVSGLNYTVSPSKKKLTGMNFVDKNGQEHKIDIDNPSESKRYKVVADSFIMSWGKEYNVLAPESECVEYPFNKAYLTGEYIKHLNKPIIINQTGRIRYED
jgi:5'-nucleotidase